MNIPREPHGGDRSMSKGAPAVPAQGRATPTVLTANPQHENVNFFVNNPTDWFADMISG